MSSREQLTLASGLAVALAASALLPLFGGTSWVMRALGALLVVVLAGLAGRRLGVPGPLQPLLGLLALGLYLCVVVAGDTLRFAVVPTGRTLDALSRLLEQVRQDIRNEAPPVPVHPGLALLAAGGVGAVAVLVDLMAVVLDRAAVAGLPLLLLFAVPSAVLPHGLGAVPFVLGAIGWLTLLLVEGNERVGRWGSPLRRGLPGGRPEIDDNGLGRVGRRIGFAALGAALVVPALVPGLDHRLVGGQGSGPGEGDGSPSSATTFNPLTRLHDELVLPDPRRLLVYRTDDPAPDYLRMTTLDQYADGTWSASDLKADPRRARVQKGISAPGSDRVAHRTVNMTVGIEPGRLDVRWLPVPFGPTKIEVKGSWLWDPTSETVFSAKTSTLDLAPYTVRASRVLPDREVLSHAGRRSIDEGVARSYGTGVTVTGRVRALAAALTRNEPTDYDKALAVQDYFTRPGNGFVYDFNASHATAGGDQLEAFLDGKHGFCEQYATAMAVLLRVEGIPSRVAVGFTPGVYDPPSRTWTVTTADAHAWPEAWFAGSGWVRFEPTPAANGATIPSYAALPAEGSPSGPKAGGPTPAPSASAAPKVGEHPEKLLPGDRSNVGGPAAASRGTARSWPLRAAVAVAVVLLTLPFLLTVVRRRRRRRPGALPAWAQLQDDATDVGHRWHPADSPRTAAAHLAAERSLPHPAVTALERIALAAERARYAPPGRTAGLDDLSADVATVRRALLAGGPGPVRLRATVLPRSTLRWLSTGVGRWVAAVLDRIDEAVAAVTRPVRRALSR
jgi:transglutaminase-like putative cysteine protease